MLIREVSSMTFQKVTMRYFIKIWFESIEEPIIFPVSEENAERFRINYQGDREGFFVCSTESGIHIAVNLKYIHMAHLLWEAGAYYEEVDSGHDDNDSVTLHFPNRHPVSFSVGEPVELADALFVLENGFVDEVLSFTDIDGEVLMFDPIKLLFLEASSSVVQEGEEEIAEDDAIE
jgi:hypothetical protein